MMCCPFCGVEVTDYPDGGICTHCGGKLPERPKGIRCAACGTYSVGNFCSHCGRSLDGTVPPVQPAQPVVQSVVQPVYVPVPPPYTQQTNCCPKCLSPLVTGKKRGFRWGLGILGFFLIPFFGILLGFCGSKKRHYRCQTCGFQWRRRR